MAAIDKDFVLGAFRRMFIDVVSHSLCESAGESIVFVLRSRLGVILLRFFGSVLKQFMKS